jgi:hypothetical protein
MQPWGNCNGAQTYGLLGALPLQSHIDGLMFLNTQLEYRFQYYGFYNPIVDAPSRIALWLERVRLQLLRKRVTSISVEKE